eukprot:Opistho-1_new@27661
MDTSRLDPDAPVLPPRQRGLTLVELVVALAILGVAMAALLPEAGNWMRGLSVRNAGESMRAGIERARMEALRRNTLVSFWLVTDSNKALSSACDVSVNGSSWVVSSANPAGKCGATPSTTDDPRLVDGWSSAEGGSNVVVQGMDANGASASSVTFNSLGQVLSTGSQLARIDIGHSSPGTRNLRVQIDAGGSVRMCDPNVDSNDPRKC